MGFYPTRSIYAFRWITNHKTAYRLILHEEVLYYCSNPDHPNKPVNYNKPPNATEHTAIDSVK